MTKEAAFTTTMSSISRPRRHTTVSELVKKYLPFMSKVATNVRQEYPYSSRQRRPNLKKNNYTRNAESENKEKGKLLHAAINSFLNPQQGNFSYDKTSEEWKQFEAFYAKYNPIPHEIEMPLFPQKYGIGGRVDLVATNNDGTVDLYDWKRSAHSIKEDDPQFGSDATGALKDFSMKNNIFFRCALQLNLYRALLESEGGITVRKMIVVQFHPDLESYKYVEIPRLEPETNAILAEEIKS